MSYLSTSSFTKAGLFSLLMLTLAGGIWYANSLETGQQAAITHLTQAEWQSSESRSPVAPGLSQDSKALAASWQAVELPLAPDIALLRQAKTVGFHQGMVLTTWIRLVVHGYKNTSGPIALYGSRIKTDGTIAIYVDGKLVHRAQEQGPLWNSTRTPLWVLLDNSPGGSPPTEILVRLEHSAKTQIAISSLWLGSADILSSRYHIRLWLQQELPATLGAAYLAVGVFALFVWLKRRRETGYLLFFGIAAASFLRGLHFYVSLPIANDWFAWLTVNALFWQVLIVHFSLCQLHGRPLVWLSRATVWLTVLVGLLTLPLLAMVPNTPKVTPLIYLAAALMGAAVGVVGGINTWRRSGEGRLVAIGIGLCTSFGVVDWLLQNNIINPEGWYLGAYANAVACTIFAALMCLRYVNAIDEVEAINIKLAQRLQIREAELELSHQRLRIVEVRQVISDERQRLMQDMHDGLGSSLIGAIRSVERGGMSNVDVLQILKDCIDDLKLTIDSMEPVAADLLLLLATLRFRLEPRLESAGVALQWNVRELPSLDWIDQTTALHILRIIQESIANILRHSQASEIRVGTALMAAGVSVSIEDNGKGFDVQKALEAMAGRGLHNQQRRAQAIDGAVSWRSGPSGTCFTLWLPLLR